MAGDYVINEILDKAHFEPIEGWLRDSQYDGKSVDEIYTTLSNKPRDSQEESDQDGDGGQGEGGSEGKGMNGDSDGKKPGNADPGGCGEVRDATNDEGKTPSPAEMAQAEQEAKNAGTLPGMTAQEIGTQDEKIDIDMLYRFVINSRPG
jgi:hypothetical protein